MKIEYQDYGAIANVVITSTVFEFRKHNRVVDTTLFLERHMLSERRGGVNDVNFVRGESLRAAGVQNCTTGS